MTDKYLTGSSLPANLIADIITKVTTGAAASLGWTSPGTGRLVSDRTGAGKAFIEVYMASVSSYQTLSLVFRRSSGAEPTSQMYLNTSNTSSSGLISYEISISEDHFVLFLEGPGPGATGAADATYGSTRMSAGIVPFTGWNATDSNAARRLVCWGPTTASAYWTAPANTVFLSHEIGADGTAWRQGVLVAPQTMGNTGTYSTLQSIPTAVTAAGKVMTFPYDVVDAKYGPRGRLDKVRFCQLKPAGVGTEYDYSNRHLLDEAGVKWRVVGFHKPSNISESPMGPAYTYNNATVGGKAWPLVAVTED